MVTLSRKLTLGTRGSALARWQTEWVLNHLRQAWPNTDYQIKLLTTTGDRIPDKPLPDIGGKGLFTAELENALRQGDIDLAVHSLKDLPIAEAPGLTLGAICERADPRDVLIARSGQTLAALPQGARVGTSSLRRAAQLLAARPDLQIRSVRGNVETRLHKVFNADYDAIVLAAAGVLRLGLRQHITEFLSLEVMLPAPGQGALAVQCRADDGAVLDLLRPLHHLPTRTAVTAERAFLETLGGGCAVPVAAYATCDPTQTIVLTGLVAACDGGRGIRISGVGVHPETLGAELAQEALRQGAAELLQ